MEFGTKLEFEPGIPQDLQADIQNLLPAEDLFAAYRLGQMTYRTNDIVLVVARHDTEVINAFPRGQYVKAALKNDEARRRSRIAHKSAHQVALLPVESPAFWLVVEDRGLPVPVTFVLFGTQYATAAAAN
jgi:hypothetical protein